MSDFNLFDSIKNDRDQMQDLARRQQSERRTVLGSLSTLRIVSKTIAAAMSSDTITDPARTEETAKRLIDRIGEQSIALHEKLGQIQDDRVLPSITGSVTAMVAGLYAHDNSQALSVDVAEILSHACKTPGIWTEHHNPESSESEAFLDASSMMQAMAPFLAEYNRFNFYHDNSDTPIQEMGNLLWNTVDDCLQRHPVSANLQNQEKEILRRNLLLRAGDLLGEAWATQTPTIKALINEAPPEERRTYKTEGFPTNSVNDLFLSSFSMLEQSLYARLNMHDMENTQSTSPSQG